MKKRIIYRFSAFIFIIPFVILAVIPLSAATESGTYGSDITWTFDADSGLLTIAGTGAVDDFKRPSAAPWYKYSEKAKNAVIEEGITGIGDYTFFAFANLTTVTIPSTVTYIDPSAFAYTYSITEFIVSGGNSFACVDGVLFDKSMNALVNYPAGKADIHYTIPSGVTTIESIAFYGSVYLESITVPDSITSIGSMAFSYCYALADISLPDHEIDVGFQAFTPSAYSGNDENWEGDFLLISNHLVRASSNTDENCIIPESVKYIAGYAFSDCNYLESIKIGKSVAAIGKYAFYDCPSLKKAIISKSVTSISGSAFYSCPELETIYYTGTSEQWNNLSITDINDDLANANIVFNHVLTQSGSCGENLTWTFYEESEKLIISGTGEMYDYLADYTTPWYEMRKHIKTIIIEDGVTSIGECAFSSCESLKTITIGEGVSRIENWAFQNCNSLTTVNYKDNEYVWNNISIGPHNKLLFDANVIFNYVPISYGDADGNGRITISDVLLIRKYLAGIDTAIDEAAADVDGNGRTTIADVLLVRKYLAGVISAFPTEE